MKKLPALLELPGDSRFDEKLLMALSKFSASQLPLKQVAQFSGLFDQDSLQFSILAKDENDEAILVKLGVFYHEIANCCPCSGEEAQNMAGHCELLLSINKQDAAASFRF